MSATEEGFTFDQLGDRAKERALSQYSEHATAFSWWGDTITEFVGTVLSFGFFVSANDVCFNGFWSQGDGASFSGSWRSEAVSLGKLADLGLADDAELRRLSDHLKLTECERVLGRCGNVVVKIDRMGRYEHSKSMIVGEVWADGDPPSEASVVSVEERVLELAQALADFLYRQLEAEYEHITSQESAEEYFDANEVLFTESGERI